MPRARSIGIAVVATAASVASGSARATAAPGENTMVGRAVFTGAVSPDPSSIIGNPTALDLGREGYHVWLGGLAALDRYGITLDHEDASGARSPGTPVGATTHSWGGQLAFFDVKPAFAFGLMLDLAPADVRPTGVDALRYHTLGSTFRQKTWFAIGGSLRLFEGFYVGGSAAVVDTSIDLAFARDTALEAGRAGVTSMCGASPCGLENPMADEIYHVTADRSSRSAAFTFGLAWQLSTNVAIGASYREPPGFNGAIEDLGIVTIQRAPRDGGGDLPDGQASVSYVPARSFEAGVRIHALPWLDAVGGARWELTSRTTQLDLRMFGSADSVPEWYPRPRGFRDLVSAWGGVEQIDDGQRFRAGARLGITSGAVTRDRLSPMQVEGWSVTGDLGAQLRLGAIGSVDFVLIGNYDSQLYVPQTVTSSAYDPIARLDCVDSNYDLATDACQKVRDGYGIDTAAGHYERWEHLFRLGLQIDWD